MPPEGGRRKRGDRVANPTELANDRRVPWQDATVELYGRKVKLVYKTVQAQWYRACGATKLTVVVVRTWAGTIPFRVFFAHEMRNAFTGSS